MSEQSLAYEWLSIS